MSVAATLALSFAIGCFAATDAAATAAEAAVPATTAHAAPAIVDDARLERAVVRARARFLATQSFDRFDVTVLARAARGQWRRGASGGAQLAYPASCVKLGYLVAAVHWCANEAAAPDCLDADVRPMIVDSDNAAAGRVVDRISGAPNGAVTGGAADDAWIERRGYAERVLDGWGVLGGQRLMHKTYPTNSGEEPGGLEALAIARAGRNAMSPDLAAALMLGIVSGRIEPQATRYMRSLLRRERFTPQGSLGAGLPPGTQLENKVGTAYDTLEDIAWFQLPGGREYVVAAFSNGWNQREPEPWDVLRLSGFIEQLLPGSAPRAHSGTTWPLAVPRSGGYELALWYDAGADNTAAARFELRVPGRAPQSLATFDQRTWGRRWLPLGTVQLPKGAAALHIFAEAPGAIAPGRLRISPTSGR
jgi:protein phosphatase methylesterase 1